MNVLSKYHLARDQNVDLSCFSESCNFIGKTAADLLSDNRTCHRYEVIQQFMPSFQAMFSCKIVRSSNISAPYTDVLSNNTTDVVNVQIDGE